MSDFNHIFFSDDDFKDFLGENFRSISVKDKTSKDLIVQELVKHKATQVTVPRYLGDTVELPKDSEFDE